MHAPGVRGTFPVQFGARDDSGRRETLRCDMKRGGDRKETKEATSADAKDGKSGSDAKARSTSLVHFERANIPPEEAARRS